MAMLRHETSPKAEQTVRISLGDGALDGCLTIPPRAHAAVIVADSGVNSRLSARHRCVAEVLHQTGLATLVIDLITQREECAGGNPRLRSDIPLLAGRLIRVTDWLAESDSANGLPIGYFATDTGAAAALVAAAGRPAVAAVVSREGRPDLASCTLDDVRTAVMLIVADYKDPLLEFNERAYDRLLKVRDKRLHVLSDGANLFDERAAAEQAARFAAEWFGRHLLGPLPRLPR
jgi:hypothetical protein